MEQPTIIYQTRDTEGINGNSINNLSSSLGNEVQPNADEIFQILSQKIAKYCQILSDLTNCEVFFKSNLNNRSLYWGTYKMVFNYSHQGLLYDRTDSLIKISGRSLSNDIANIVEELINVENYDKLTVNNTNNVVNDPEINKSIDREDVELKECVVYMDRLDDQLYEHYLEKFEKSRVFVEDDLSIDELCSDQNRESSLQSESDEKEFGLLYDCDLCANQVSYKHLPQLKLHILKEHEKVPFSETTPFKCSKCNFESNSKPDYYNHVLLCYYPDLYTCKLCTQEFNSYSEFQYHTKYIHINVYGCSLCQRRFKNTEELMEHDQLMHSKSINYCEICFEPLKSRKELYFHYKDKHLYYESTSNRSNISTNHDKSSINKTYKSFQSNNDQNLNKNQNKYNINLNSITELKTNSKIFEVNSDQQLISCIDNDSNSSKANNDENDKTDIDDTLGGSKVETKMQKNELIRGLLDRKHQCKWCAQRFYTKSQLRQHETTHTNTVLFCPVCDKEFTHKDRLSGHMKCHMEPSLECKICGKKFKRLCNLYNHELVHGLTEHAFMLCQFCGRGFRSRRDYQNHVIANHRDQLMKSEIIKNSNNVINDGFNGPSPSSSLLANEIKNNASNSQIVRSSRVAAGDKNDSFSENITDTETPFRSLKNRNKNDFRNNFIEENDDEDDDDDDDDDEDDENKIENRDFKKSKKDNFFFSNYEKPNLNNTQLLVKAAEFVDNNGDK